MLKTKQSGMTLIELVVAVAIVAILAAGLLAVGSYVDTQIKIKRTEATIQLLVTALERYHDFYKAFPNPNTVYPYGVDASIEKLYYKLILAPDAKKILDQIDRGCIKDADSDENLEVVDAWNRPLKYEYDEDWNFPVITSAGPVIDANEVRDDVSSKNL